MRLHVAPIGRVTNLGPTEYVHHCCWASAKSCSGSLRSLQQPACGLASRPVAPCGAACTDSEFEAQTMFGI
jgi:hypothetical protein